MMKDNDDDDDEIDKLDSMYILQNRGSNFSATRSLFSVSSDLTVLLERVFHRRLNMNIVRIIAWLSGR